MPIQAHSFYTKYVTDLRLFGMALGEHTSLLPEVNMCLLRLFEAVCCSVDIFVLIYNPILIYLNL